MLAHDNDAKDLHLQMALDAVNVLQDTVMAMQRDEAITFELTKYHKNKEGNKTFTSPSFYCSPNGYHMAVRVHANGSDSGLYTHVTVSMEIFLTYRI
jgi:hypothetical protein